MKRLIDFGVPIGLYLLYFQFYNFGKISPSEVIKTTGLLSITLISLTLFVGPLCRLFNPAGPKYYGLLAGLVSLIILAVVTLTSNKTALNALSPTTWKRIQSLSYLALIIAVLHFYLVESVNGVL